MLRLSKKAQESFKSLYLVEKGVDLSDEDATKMAIELLTFVSLIYKPIPKIDVTEQLDIHAGICSLGGKENK